MLWLLCWWQYVLIISKDKNVWKSWKRTCFIEEVDDVDIKKRSSGRMLSYTPWGRLWNSVNIESDNSLISRTWLKMKGGLFRKNDTVDGSPWLQHVVEVKRNVLKYNGTINECFSMQFGWRDIDLIPLWEWCHLVARISVNSSSRTVWLSFNQCLFNS